MDGQIYCRVERDAITEVRGRLFDMLNEQHFLLLASGSLVTSVGIGVHTLRAATPEAFWLNPYTDPDTVPPAETDPVYEGCGTTKICIGSPSGCINDRDCRMFAAVVFNENRFYFELLSEG